MKGNAIIGGKLLTFILMGILIMLTTACFTIVAETQEPEGGAGPVSPSAGVANSNLLVSGFLSVSNSDPESSNVISADPMALQEVFSNLLENAVKHNGSGTEISAEVTRQNGRMQVRIADNGSGVPSDVLSNIFEKGSRNYRPGRARGTGMGLYLCKLLVELHGGEISAHSQNGSGTEFRVSLPLRRVEQA